jgi:hypothetical protein
VQAGAALRAPVRPATWPAFALGSIRVEDVSKCLYSLSSRSLSLTHSRCPSPFTCLSVAGARALALPAFFPPPPSPSTLAQIGELLGHLSPWFSPPDARGELGVHLIPELGNPEHACSAKYVERGDPGVELVSI